MTRLATTWAAMAAVVLGAALAMSPAGRAAVQYAPTPPGGGTQCFDHTLSITSCVDEVAAGYYYVFPGGGFIQVRSYSPPQCIDPSTSTDISLAHCPNGMSPGLWFWSYGDWVQWPLDILYATGSPPAKGPPLDCNAHPELCKLQPCPPMVVPGGNPALPQVSGANSANPNCTRTPPAQRPAVSQPPRVAIATPPPAAPIFCKSNPGKCLRPAGQPREFCIAHPEQCSMPDAPKPQIASPEARGETGP